MNILHAPDIEDSIEPFLTSTNTVLLLSRYDGLDLPDEACRLLVFGGLPSGTNLQERFLWSKIENSRDKSTEGFEDLWKAFLSKGDDWKDAEAAILALRDKSSRHDDPISRKLNSVVADEVAYLYTM